MFSTISHVRALQICTEDNQRVEGKDTTQVMLCHNGLPEELRVASTSYFGF